MELQGLIELSQPQLQQQRQQSEQITLLPPLAEELVGLLTIMEVIVIKLELELVVQILSGIQIV